MNDYELIEAVAAGLRAYATAPLSACEVHEWDQPGYENTTGLVVVRIAEGAQEHIAIGDTSESLQDDIALEIVGMMPEADTQANRRSMVTLREQLVDWLRDNRTLSAGGELTTTNAQEPIRWSYGTTGEGDKVRRICVVRTVYAKTPDA